MGSQRSAADPRSISLLLADTVPFFVGYGCLDAWSQMVSASVLTSASTSDQVVKYLFALLPPLVFILISDRVAPLVRRRHREVIYLFGFAAMFGTFTLYLIVNSAVGTEWLPATNILLGVGHVILVIGWWEKLTTLRIGDMWVALGCSIAIGALINLVTNIIPAPFDYMLFCLLPLVSTFLLQTRHRNGSKSAGLVEGVAERAFAQEPVESGRGAMRPTAESPQLGPASIGRMFSAVPFILVIVLGLANIPSEAFVVIEHSAGYGDVGLFTIFLNTLQRMLVNLAAVALAYVAMRVNVTVTFYLAVPAITLAAFFLALGYDPYIGILHAVSRVGSETIRYIVVYLLFRAVLERRAPALFCYSLMVLFHGLGALLGLCAATAFYGNRMLIALMFMLVLMTAMLLVIAAQQRGEFSPSFARGKGGFGSASREGGGAPAEYLDSPSAASGKIVPDPEALMSAFVAQHGLTQRERSVMELWVRGHSTAFIEERLCVSKHTVKTHVNHIYEKTGVNSKEGLILLYDRFCSSLNTEAPQGQK